MGNVSNACFNDDGGTRNRILDLENLLLQFEKEHEELNEELNKEQTKTKELQHNITTMESEREDIFEVLVKEKAFSKQLELKVNELNLRIKAMEQENEMLKQLRQSPSPTDKRRKHKPQNTRAQRQAHTGNNTHARTQPQSAKKNRNHKTSSKIPSSASRIQKTGKFKQFSKVSMKYAQHHDRDRDQAPATTMHNYSSSHSHNFADDTDVRYATPTHLSALAARRLASVDAYDSDPSPDTHNQFLLQTQAAQFEHNVSKTPNNNNNNNHRFHRGSKNSRQQQNVSMTVNTYHNKSKSKNKRSSLVHSSALLSTPQWHESDDDDNDGEEDRFPAYAPFGTFPLSPTPQQAEARPMMRLGIRENRSAKPGTQSTRTSVAARHLRLEDQNLITSVDTDTLPKSLTLDFTSLMSAEKDRDMAGNMHTRLDLGISHSSSGSEGSTLSLRDAGSGADWRGTMDFERLRSYRSAGIAGLDADHNPKTDATQMYEWVHYSSADSGKIQVLIAELLASRTSAHRANIALAYSLRYENEMLVDITKVFDSKLLLKIISGLLMAPAEYDALLMYNAIVKWDIEAVAGFICSRSVKQMQKISVMYKKKYKITLRKQMMAVADYKNKQTLAKIFNAYFVEMIHDDNNKNKNKNKNNRKNNNNKTRNRNNKNNNNNKSQRQSEAIQENGIDMAVLKRDFEYLSELQRKGNKISGNDKLKFSLVFINTNDMHLRMLETQWKNKYKASLESLIKKYLYKMKVIPSTTGKMCVNRLKFALDSSAYFAEKIKELGTFFLMYQETIASIFIARFEFDLNDIQLKFHAGKYGDNGRTLAEWIKWKSNSSKYGFFLIQMLNNCERFNLFRQTLINERDSIVNKKTPNSNSKIQKML